MKQRTTALAWGSIGWAGTGVIAGGTLALLLAARGTQANDTPAVLDQAATTQKAPAGDRKGRRCVAVSFVDPNQSRQIFPGNSLQLTIRGEVPCADAVVGWSRVGPVRLWDDGLVECLVIPVPPCPQGDGSVFYAWLGFPNPNAN
ncbi:MAG: hypothetical protein ACKO4V_03475 [Planctomycetota bacterium]